MTAMWFAQNLWARVFRSASPTSLPLERAGGAALAATLAMADDKRHRRSDLALPRAGHDCCTAVLASPTGFAEEGHAVLSFSINITMLAA